MQPRGESQITQVLGLVIHCNLSLVRALAVEETHITLVLRTALCHNTPDKWAQPKSHYLGERPIDILQCLLWVALSKKTVTLPRFCPQRFVTIPAMNRQQSEEGSPITWVISAEIYHNAPCRQSLDKSYITWVLDPAICHNGSCGQSTGQSHITKCQDQ